MKNDLALGSRGKVFQKMERDGLVEENKKDHTKKRISRRFIETEFSSKEESDERSEPKKQAHTGAFTKQENERIRHKAKKDRVYQEEKKKTDKLHLEKDEISFDKHPAIKDAVVHNTMQKIREDEDDNAAIEAMHATDEVAVTGIDRMQKHVPSLRETKLRFDPVKNDPVSDQKRSIKKQYASHIYATADPPDPLIKNVSSSTGSFLKRVKEKMVVLAKNHSPALIAMIVCGALLVMVINEFSMIGAIVSEAGGVIVESTYLSSDEDILSADARYQELESALQHRIDSVEEEHPGYDEYRYQVDEITHDPYALTSYLTAKYGNYEAEDIEDVLQTLFDWQFIFSTSEETEIRTRKITDPNTGLERMEQYEWKILNIQLENNGMDAIACMDLNSDQKDLYQIYQACLGNRSYLFGEAITIGNIASGGMSYDIPSEALSDECFRNMINEAEKYLGYPYVWGGSSPQTSFDCSGFVCWVINNCGNGWNVGRTTAEGLRDLCTYVSYEDARPGDLIFFENTYNTTGASHVGIYVGNDVMIHCGDPIQYSSIASDYWQSHLLCFGRLS